MDLDALLDDLAQLPPVGDWVTRAACQGMPETFVERPRDGAERSLVERVCRRCPVRVDCATFATENRVQGTYAGRWHNYSTGAVWELAEAS